MFEISDKSSKKGKIATRGSFPFAAIFNYFGKFLAFNDFHLRNDSSESASTWDLGYKVLKISRLLITAIITGVITRQLVNRTVTK